MPLGTRPLADRKPVVGPDPGSPPARRTPRLQARPPGRSLRHLIDTVAHLQRRGVDFRSLQESLNTTTAGGKLVFHLFAALAEFERDIIRERTMAGLAAAKARGRKGDRPPMVTPEKLAVARQMYDSRQHKVGVIAMTQGVSPASIYRHLGSQQA